MVTCEVVSPQVFPAGGWSGDGMIMMRKATDADADALWQMLHEVAQEADSFPFELDMERDESLARWLSPDKWTYVACQDDEVVGTYALRPNHGGPGSHVANAGYIVRSEHRGKGIGTAMVEHSLDEGSSASRPCSSTWWSAPTNGRSTSTLSSAS
jgi:predicted N-acetyltransferase YhbS